MLPGRIGGRLIGFLAPPRRSGTARVVHYLLPVLLVGATLLARVSLTHAAEGTAVSIIFVPAILVSAYLGGLGPGLLATAAASLVSGYFLMRPAGSLGIQRPEHQIQLAFLCFSGLAISLLVDALHRTRWRLEERTASVRESEERFRTMADGSPVILWVTDASGENQFVNRKYLEYFGVTFEEMLGARWQPFFHPDDAPRYVEEFMSAVRERRPFSGEARVRRKDEWRWITTHGEPRYSETGDFLGHVGITMDVSERKQAQDALRESEERLRVVVEAAGEGIVLRRRDGEIPVFNPAAELLTGLTASQMQGLTPTPPGWYTVREDGTLLPPEARPNRTALVTGKSTSNVIVGHHKTDGTTTWTSVNSQPVFEAGQTAAYAVVGTFTDVTEQRRQVATQRQLEEQLQQARKLESIGRLAGGIAHDFNNLLTVILAGAETLKDDVAAGSPAQPELIDEIHGAGKRAAELTRQLLAFARKQVIAPVALDLNTVVRGSEKLLRRLLGEDVELMTTAGSDLWSVRCDPGQIEQVILNLAINARDAMPGGGKLTIETANVQVDEGLVALHPFMRSGPHVRLAISDTGTGMTPEVKAHAFEPFFTTKPQGKGTGLGLATVYGIVKQSEGYILLDSAADRGTTFELYFPRTLDAMVTASAEPVATRRGSETVLVVEDDPQVREVTLRALRAGGYRVLAASCGREALEVAGREERPMHLLVTDVIMPGLNGRQLADELRRGRPGLRVLFVSGYAGEVITQAGADDAGVELLGKPFTTVTLLARVRALLDAR
jgi:two-component system cell cycle sensor histidine kinase/response regulator CckA